MHRSNRPLLAGFALAVLTATAAPAQQDSLVVVDPPNRSVNAFAVTPDGGFVAYQRNNGTLTDIFTLDLRAKADHLVEERVTEGRLATHPSTDSTGRYIGFFEPNGVGFNARRIDRQTGADTIMGSLPAGERVELARLSPNGSKVAVLSRLTAQPFSYKLRFFGPGATSVVRTSTLIQMAPSGQIWWKDGSAAVVTLETTSPFGTFRSIVGVSATTGALTNLGCGTADRMATVTWHEPERVRFLRTVTVGGSSTRLMSFERGAACSTTTQLANLGSMQVLTAATTLDGRKVVLSANLGGHDVMSVAAATGAVTDVTMRNSSIAPIAPWPDEDGELAWFGTVASASRIVLEAVNLEPANQTFETLSAKAVPPFDVESFSCGYPLNFPSNFEIECDAVLRSTTDKRLLVFQDYAAGTVTRTDGPHVVRVALGTATRLHSERVVTCEGGLQLDVRLSVVDPTVIQDDVVFEVEGLITKDYCAAFP